MSDFAYNLLFPRPFTAKKKKGFQYFSPAVSCTRLRRIQEFIKNEDSLTKLDGILCILGVDSRYNSGTKQLLNYLLFGFCELLPKDVSGCKVTEEELEDLVVVVKAESVHVYCNPLNYPHLLRYIAHWRNLHIHCLTKEEYDDNDDERAEEFKITSFISMVEGCEQLGIPYGEPSLGDKQPPFNPFILEKWPLIQAFALEDFGSGGFFTMKHKVADVTEYLNLIYGLLDPVIVETLVDETLPLFERHFKAVLTNVDVGSHNGPLTVSESSLSEPILSYFTHGHIVEKESSKRSATDCHPFVLLGLNSSRQNIKTSGRKFSVRNNNTAFGNSGLNDSGAKHMVCVAVDPKGTLTCARTYFLQNGFVPWSLNTAGENSSTRHCKDLRLLMDLYLLSINAVVKGVETFSQTSNRKKSFSVVLSELKSGMENRKIDVEASFLSNNVEFSIEACDCHGRVVNLQDDKALSAIKRVCLYLYDIPSIEHPGDTLGSVVFGETFLDSTVMKLVPGGVRECNSSFVFLTENISRLVSWQGDHKGKQLSKQMESFAKSKSDSDVLGKQLLFCGQVFVASPVNKWEAGSLYIYQRGFLFIHARLGIVLLPCSKLSRLQFRDKGVTSTMTVLFLTYHPNIKENLPPYFLTEHSCLVLAFTPDSHVYRQLFSDVIHFWEENQLPYFPQFETVTDIPEYLEEQLLCLEKQQFLHSSSKLQDLSSGETFLATLKSFVLHLSASNSFGDKPVQSEDLSMLLENKAVRQGRREPEFELLLTVLTGVPQSGKDSLCLALVALAKENSKWLIVQRPENSSDPFDPKVLQDSLASIFSSQRRLHTRLSASGKRLRVIVVTPGFTDVIDVVQAIKMHPDGEVAKCLRIGAVTCCVDPLNSFMENRLTLPKLLEQCAQGWVNNVVFTSCIESQNAHLTFIQTLVRACNPDAAFILAKGGEVTRTPDVELILSDCAFDESKMIQKRQLMCPGWSLGLFSSGVAEPPVNEVRIPFYGPLQKSKFVASLKALHGPISLKGIREAGAIHSLQGRVCFSEEDPHKEVRVQWARLNEVLKMNNVDSTTIPRSPSAMAQENSDMTKAPEYCLVFTGFNLHEQALKNWLRTCCKPAPMKEKPKTRKDLSDKEFKKISSEHKFDPLPPGWFYNGLHYVSLTGDKDYDHPLIEIFIESYLLQANEEIKRRNLLVKSHPVRDIFTKP
ncbi:dynein axonemal assembly factor 9-like [Montipora foliosa]|uniref:dynein axonemal assembly factor 9-like n=1 Tax=Montipora foliosa TaxID=591990 RepID=UPI0035F1E54F